jgi:hypothetical protein
MKRSRAKIKPESEWHSRGQGFDSLQVHQIKTLKPLKNQGFFVVRLQELTFGFAAIELLLQFYCNLLTMLLLVMEDIFHLKNEGNCNHIFKYFAL